MLAGIRHDAHPPHRVAHEHDRTTGTRRIEDGRQVAAELGDVAPVEVRLPGTSVTALVVGDDPEAVVDEGAALQHPRLHREGEAVDEDDGRMPAAEVWPCPARRLGSVDLDVER